jgi:LPS export ABC transporter protein LptC
LKKYVRFLIIFPLILGGCSFDYGDSAGEDTGPDLIMNDVEYVRVRDGNPQVRFEAEYAERYEKQQTMELRHFTFEQFDTAGVEINSKGRVDEASVELESGNIHMKGGVRIEVESEDITIETESLEWQDKERAILGAEGDPVGVLRSDGTSFTGYGFTADARKRTWSFSGAVEGTYVHEDKDDDDTTESDE